MDSTYWPQNADCKWVGISNSGQAKKKVILGYNRNYIILILNYVLKIQKR